MHPSDAPKFDWGVRDTISNYNKKPKYVIVHYNIS